MTKNITTQITNTERGDFFEAELVRIGKNFDLVIEFTDMAGSSCSIKIPMIEIVDLRSMANQFNDLANKYESDRWAN